MRRVSILKHPSLTRYAERSNLPNVAGLSKRRATLQKFLVQMVDREVTDDLKFFYGFYLCLLVFFDFESEYLNDGNISVFEYFRSKGYLLDGEYLDDTSQ